MDTRLRLSLLSLVVLASSSCFSLPTVRGVPRYGRLSLDGDLKASVGGVGSSNDLDDLGLDDDEDVFLPRVDFDWGHFHATAQGYDVSFNGEGVAEATLDLGGDQITAGTPVQTDIDLEFYSASVMFDILPRFLLEVGVGAGAALISYDFNIQSLAGPEVVSSNNDDLPFAFLTGRVAKKLFGLEAILVVSGLGLEVDDDDLTYYAADASLGYRIFDMGLEVKILVGYVIQHIEIEYDENGGDVDAELDLSGPYAGLMISL